MIQLDKLDALLVTNPTNIRYLTGFVGVEDRDAYILLTQKQLFLFTNALYIEQAKKIRGISVVQISRENPISGELVRLCSELKISKLGFEEVNLTVAELTKLKNILDGVTLVPTRDRIEKLRQIKRPDEIANIKKACVITDLCFDYIIKKLKPEVTENEIAGEIETFFRKNNATSAFSPIVAFGKHTSQPHYLTRPGLKEDQGRALRVTDIILLDFGASVNGYCADMTRVVFIGKPKPEWIRAYDTVMEAQKSAIVYLASCSSPGLEFRASGAKLDRLARAKIKSAGFEPYPHGLGHGVGLDIHETPRLNYKKDALLKDGMVFSIEPGVYVPGCYGIRIEDLVRLTDTGIEILTKSTKRMIIL
jgi:Xaa-Pro aminopeptidase